MCPHLSAPPLYTDILDALVFIRQAYKKRKKAPAILIFFCIYNTSGFWNTPKDVNIY